MSATENKRLMQTIFAKVAEGDGSLFVEHLADDVVMRVTGQYSWSRTFQGKEALLRDLYGHVRAVTQGARKTIPIRFIADDDHVVVEARGDMTNKAGVPYRNEYCLVFRLANGKIVEMREYQDSTLCERVLGLYPAQLTSNTSQRDVQT
jgi:ketosteroid isomerase-like protein